jgi:two-component system, OmpR family, phosphate regulon response regulator PhoB
MRLESHSSVDWVGGRVASVTETGGEACPICMRSHRSGERSVASRILVAEDDPSIAHLIAYNLAQDGHFLTVVSDGSAALRALREAPPDLLILDLLLPLQSGWRVLRDLRSRSESPSAAFPVLVVSALACERLERELGQNGAQRVLGKPFSVDELRGTVRGLLEGSFTRTQSSGHPPVTVGE